MRFEKAKDPAAAGWVEGKVRPSPLYRASSLTVQSWQGLAMPATRTATWRLY